MDADQRKRRIEAARILRNMSQVEMDRLGSDDGLGRQELSRTERGELPLTRVRREVLARVLAVPERWFLSDDVDEILGFDDSVAGDRLAELERLSREAAATLNDLRAEVQALRLRDEQRE